MATYQIYTANRLIGGTDGCLDYIDGAGLNNKDSAIVAHAVDNNIYFYRLDASSGATQNAPEVIAPNSNAGTKRWLLVDVVAINITPRNQIECQPNSPSGDDVAINEFSTDGTMSGQSSTAAPTEKAVKTYADTTFPATTKVTMGITPGFMKRPRFTMGFVEGTNTLTIVGGLYHINGASERLVNITTLTFTTGSGGSNANSDDMDVADTWHYIYIDDSSLTAGQTTLVASNILNCKTAPAWSDAKNGWYGTGVGSATTNDRCIFWMYDLDGAGDIYNISCEGTRFVQFASNFITILSAVDIDDVSYTVTTNSPTNCSLCMINIWGHQVDTDTALNIRFIGESNIYDNLVRMEAANQDWVAQNLPIPIDSNQQFDVAMGVAGGNTAYIFQTGLFLPRGM